MTARHFSIHHQLIKHITIHVTIASTESPTDQKQLTAMALYSEAGLFAKLIRPGPH
jgi:hypothetical protein